MILTHSWARWTALVVSYLSLRYDATQNRNTSLARIEPFVQDLVDRYQIPGLALSVVRQHGAGDGAFEEYQGHFGVATTDGAALDSDSLFALASNSKLFTYFAIGLLVDNSTILTNGETFGWNTKIKAVLPSWTMQDDWARDHIDVTDLFAHRSGMPRHDHARGDRDSPADVATSYIHLKPSYEARQHWQYTNHGFITLSHIVTVLAGVPYHQYVHDHILSPLGMHSTTLNATLAEDTGHRTHGYLRFGRNETSCRDWWLASSGIKHPMKIDASCLGQSRAINWWTDGDGLFEAGAAGIITSTPDMIKWLKELVRPTLFSTSLIQRASKALEIAQGDFVSPSTGIIGFGLGQMSWTYRGTNLIGHTGLLIGQRSLLVRVPDHDTAIMVWTSDETLGVPLLKVIAYKVAEHVAGRPNIDIEADEMGTFFAHQSPTVDVPSMPKPPTPQEDTLGAYHDPGYGNITLTLLEPRDAPHASLINHLGPANIPLNTTGPVYVTEMDKAFITHLAFTHFSGELFNWTAVGLWPELGHDKAPTGQWLPRVDGIGSAIIDGHGVGMYGNFWGAEGDAGKGYAQEGWTTEEKRRQANVWFDKVSR